VEIIREINQTH